MDKVERAREAFERLMHQAAVDGYPEKYEDAELVRAALEPLAERGREEMIATIIDPDAMNAGFDPERGAAQNDIDRARDAALAKARAIIAALREPSNA